ncbi:MAG: DUF1688 family protein [Polyangiaceae bacterium]
MSVSNDSEAEYRYLTSPRAIRERAAEILEAARRDELAHWALDEGKLPEVVERVLRVTRAAYPALEQIPYHSRFRHFDVGGVARLDAFEDLLERSSADEQLAARAELVIISVLLDAGAGPGWSYREIGGQVYARSEGLAVASYHLFAGGGFSSAAARARADAAGLLAFSNESLLRAFQVSNENPLAGASGRAELMRSLGRVVSDTPRYFGERSPRLGNLALHLRDEANGGSLPASAVLGCVLEALGPIWPSRERLADKNLGDVFRHSRFGLVPLHKLSQWLSYSLIEALELSGVVVNSLNELTGLAEYRNGGLFVDAEVLTLKDPSQRERLQRVDSDLIIEWRSLTVALLDRVAELLRDRLVLDARRLPLARVLEGGTWSAGRQIAKEKRSDGGPPIQIESDGTVF